MWDQVLAIAFTILNGIVFGLYLNAIIPLAVECLPITAAIGKMLILRRVAPLFSADAKRETAIRTYLGLALTAIAFALMFWLILVSTPQRSLGVLMSPIILAAASVGIVGQAMLMAQNLGPSRAIGAGALPNTMVLLFSVLYLSILGRHLGFHAVLGGALFAMGLTVLMLVNGFRNLIPNVNLAATLDERDDRLIERLQSIGAAYGGLLRTPQFDTLQERFEFATQLRNQGYSGVQSGNLAEASVSIGAAEGELDMLERDLAALPQERLRSDLLLNLTYLSERLAEIGTDPRIETVTAELDAARAAIASPEISREGLLAESSKVKAVADAVFALENGARRPLVKRAEFVRIDEQISRAAAAAFVLSDPANADKIAELLNARENLVAQNPAEISQLLETEKLLYDLGRQVNLTSARLETEVRSDFQTVSLHRATAYVPRILKRNAEGTVGIISQAGGPDFQLILRSASLDLSRAEIRAQDLMAVGRDGLTGVRLTVSARRSGRVVLEMEDRGPDSSHHAQCTLEAAKSQEANLAEAGVLAGVVSAIAAGLAWYVSRDADLVPIVSGGAGAVTIVGRVAMGAWSLRKPIAA